MTHTHRVTCNGKTVGTYPDRKTAHAALCELAWTNGVLTMDVRDGTTWRTSIRWLVPVMQEAE